MSSPSKDTKSVMSSPSKDTIGFRAKDNNPLIHCSRVSVTPNNPNNDPNPNPKDITIIHRSRVKLMFHNAEEAQKHGYSSYHKTNDVSPAGRVNKSITNYTDHPKPNPLKVNPNPNSDPLKVNPFTGLRYDAKKLFQSIKQA